MEPGQARPTSPSAWPSPRLIGDLGADGRMIAVANSFGRFSLTRTVKHAAPSSTRHHQVPGTIKHALLYSRRHLHRRPRRPNVTRPIAPSRRDDRRCIDATVDTTECETLIEGFRSTSRSPKMTTARGRNDRHHDRRNGSTPPKTSTFDAGRSNATPGTSYHSHLARVLTLASATIRSPPQSDAVQQRLVRKSAPSHRHQPGCTRAVRCPSPLRRARAPPLAVPRKKRSCHLQRASPTNSSYVDRATLVSVSLLSARFGDRPASR